MGRWPSEWKKLSDRRSLVKLGLGELALLALLEEVLLVLVLLVDGDVEDVDLVGDI